MNQDLVVLYAAVFAVVILAGWWLVEKFKYAWLNKIYVGQMLILYLVMLKYMGGYK